MENLLKKATIQTSQHHTKQSIWADLPKDVLFHIIKHLHITDTTTEITCLRSVCSSWRSSLPLAEFPMREIHLQVPSLEGESNNSPLFLLKTRFYLFCPLPCVGSGGSSSTPWLAKVGELGFKKWRLLNPFSGLTYLGTYMRTEPAITGEISLLDCRVLELARPMYLVHKLDYNAMPISKKVAAGEGVVLVLLKENAGGGLVFWRLGDQQWSKIQGLHALPWSCVTDIAFHNGKFFVFQWNASKCGVLLINPEGHAMGFYDFGINLGNMSHELPGTTFVSTQSNGCLYLVISANPNHKQTSKGHAVLMKSVNEDNKWECCKHLGDVTLFLGVDNVSFALPSPVLNLLMWKPNSIYSISSRSSEGRVSFPKNSKGLKWLKDIHCAARYKCFKLFSMDEKQKDIKLSNKKQQELSKLFFPPPDFVKWRCPSLGDVQVSLDQL